MTDRGPLPVGRRPKCRACGRELAPNYDTKLTGETHVVVRLYRITERDWSSGAYGLGKSDHAVTKDDFRAKQAPDGRWYVEKVVRKKTREWRGTYGRYEDGLFCGLNCAYRWAVNVCRETDKQGDHWTTYKKAKAKGSGDE